jgi:hypothetical protein
LLRASALLLRPLVRVLLQSGVTFPALVETLRRLFVEVAATELLTRPGALTDSRVSLLTGIHRKEIRRLRTQPAGAAEQSTSLGIATQVVARWAGSPFYADPEGRPLVLPRTGGAPAAPSFDALVAAVTTDVRPRAVLDELLSHGIVALDAEDRVRLDTAAFVPRPGRDEQLFYFARNTRDHLAAASANLLAPGPAPFLDRSVHYDRLRPGTAARLEAEGREAAMRMLLGFNRLALELADADDKAAPAGEAGGSRSRINLGVYLYVDEEPLDGPA